MIVAVGAASARASTIGDGAVIGAAAGLALLSMIPFDRRLPGHGHLSGSHRVGAGGVGDALLARSRAGRSADPAAASAVAGLTEREREVAALVARGRTNAELADELFLSLSTVKTHLASIQRRVGARNRVEIAAALWASGTMD